MPALGDTRPLVRPATLILFVLFAACSAPPPAPPIPEGAPPDYPARLLDELPGNPVLYRVAAIESSAHARVYRGGTLARLGHDHVISAGHVEGLVAVAPGRDGGSIAVGDLYAVLGELVVDDPAQRAAFDFNTEPSDEDRDGTRRNMLASIGAAANPWIRIRVEGLLLGTAGAASGRDALPEEVVAASVTVTLAGNSHSYPTDILVRRDGDAITGRGDLQILQSDFGIEPFSVMGGALTVQDRIDLSFSVTANR